MLSIKNILIEYSSQSVNINTKFKQVPSQINKIAVTWPLFVTSPNGQLQPWEQPHIILSVTIVSLFLSISMCVYYSILIKRRRYVKSVYVLKMVMIFKATGQKWMVAVDTWLESTRCLASWLPYFTPIFYIFSSLFLIVLSSNFKHLFCFLFFLGVCVCIYKHIYKLNFLLSPLLYFGTNFNVWTYVFQLIF